MKGNLEEELVVGVSASEMWEIYGTLKLANLAREYLPNVVIDIEQGDGSAGTIIKVTNTNDKGEPTGSYFKEKYLVVDNEKRIKLTQHTEGEFADAGCEFFAARLEIIEKGENECIIKSACDFEIDFERVNDAIPPAIKFLGVLQILAHSMANHLLQKKLPAANLPENLISGEII